MESNIVFIRAARARQNEKYNEFIVEVIGTAGLGLSLSAWPNSSKSPYQKW
jgi:hypothetical protein